MNPILTESRRLALADHARNALGIEPPDARFSAALRPPPR